MTDENEDINVESTSCKPSDIKRVSRDTVNKLLSAQVSKKKFYIKILIYIKGSKLAFCPKRTGQQ